MKTLEFFYEGLEPLDNLTALAAKDDLLFFDIETTGLSRQKNHIYLIGVGFYTDSGLKIMQWFAENENEELLILNEFINFSSSFVYLVNYNGKSFDIPFTTERLLKYGLSMPELNSIDIYTLIKPLKNVLSLNDMTQKSIEHFLNIKREDKYNGGELIPVYKQYTRSKSYSDFNLLITHNKEDVLNMHYLTSILSYDKLSELALTYDNHVLNEYTDFNNLKHIELLMSGLHNFESLPKSFNTFKNREPGAFLMNFSNNGSLQIRIPVIEKELFYYLENYKDYYYLPNEKICILKSMAGGVQKENRENATKDNCKVTLHDKFIPLPGNAVISGIRIFKDSYKSKQHYIRLDDYIALDSALKTQLLKLYYNYFFL